jgi:hypothetical protein
VVTYLRCTIGRWKIDLSSDEARQAFRLIDEEGVRVFRTQPGFVRCRLMVANPSTTIAVAEWDSRRVKLIRCSPEAGLGTQILRSTLFELLVCGSKLAGVNVS